MVVKYYVQRKAKSGYEWDEGYFNSVLESNKTRAIKEAKRIAEKYGKKVRVKNWKGKIIFEN